MSDKVKIPKRDTKHAAGDDLFSEEYTVIKKRSHTAVRAGTAISIPNECYGCIASRSGLSLFHALEVGTGVIDADYCGNLIVFLYNHHEIDFYVNVGHKIAQLILVMIDAVQVERLSDTERGVKEFVLSISKEWCLSFYLYYIFFVTTRFVPVYIST